MVLLQASTWPKIANWSIKKWVLALCEYWSVWDKMVNEWTASDLHESTTWDAKRFLTFQAHVSHKPWYTQQHKMQENGKGDGAHKKQQLIMLISHLSGLQHKTLSWHQQEPMLDSVLQSIYQKMVKCKLSNTVSNLGKCMWIVRQIYIVYNPWGAVFKLPYWIGLWEKCELQCCHI